MERRGEFGTWQMGSGREGGGVGDGDFKSKVDTLPRVSSPRAPLTTLRFRRRRSRFRKSSFYEAPLTNKIPLKVFFSSLSLSLSSENFKLFRARFGSLSVSGSHCLIPWEPVA